MLKFYNMGAAASITLDPAMLDAVKSIRPDLEGRSDGEVLEQVRKDLLLARETYVQRLTWEIGFKWVVTLCYIYFF